MNDELKMKMVIEWDVDENQLKQTWEKASKIVWESIKEQKLKLTVEKSEMEKNLKTVNKTLDEFMKKWENWVLLYRAKLEKNEFETRIKEINQQLDELNEKAEKTLDINAVWHLLNSGVFQKVWDWVVSLWKKILDLWDSAQQAQISFTTMLWSWEKAKDLIKDLSEFASKTPFELSWIRDSAKQLLAMWVQAEDMIPTLKALWDVSAWLNVPLERLALNYWQVLTQWKLTGKELKDFTTAWVPLIDELAKNLNKSKTEIQDMVSAWEISAQDMVDAFDSMTSAWWRFADLMEQQSTTLSWLLSNLNDEINLTGEAIWTELVPTASTFVGRLWNIVQYIREWVQENPKLTWALVTFTAVAWWLIAIWWTLASVRALVATAFWAVALPVLWVVAALWAVAAVWVTVYNNLQEVADRAEFAWETFESLTEKLKANEQAMADLDKAFQNWAISLEEYKQKKQELQEEEVKLKWALDRTNMSLEDVKSSIDDVSNANISNEQKLKRLQEIKDRAYSTWQTVEQLKASLASLDWDIQWMKDNQSWKLTRAWFKQYQKKYWKNVWAQFGLLWESWDQWEQRLQTERDALQERLDNYEGHQNEMLELDKQIANLEIEVEKDKQKKLKDLWWWGWGWSTKNNELEQKKKELKEQRDLKIKEVQESTMAEEDKYNKMLEISERYKNELVKLQWEETDQLIKNAEKQLKAKETQYKKEIDYYEDLEKVVDKVEQSNEKYRKSIEDIWKEWDKVKEKAEESLRATNNSIKELDDEFNDNLVEQFNKNKEEMRKALSQNDWLDWIWKNMSLDQLLNWWSDDINGIDIQKAIDYKKLVLDQEYLEWKLTEEQKKQAEIQDRMTESQKKQLEYEEKRAVLLEKKNILEAIANWTLDNAWIQYKDETKEVVQYFDTQKQEWVDITDFKNSEYARDVLDNQTALNQKLLDLQAEHQNELKEYWNQVIEIKKKYEQDTNNYKAELQKKKEAFAQHVREMNEIAATLSSRARAYWWSLLEWQVSMVWEHWPEAIVARQSSYVQPANAVSNNSVVYNNQSSLNINWLEFGNFNSIDEMLAELKNRLTYRS